MFWILWTAVWAVIMSLLAYTQYRIDKYDPFWRPANLFLGFSLVLMGLGILAMVLAG